MDLQTYLETKQERERTSLRPRGLCTRCRLAPAVCDCSDLKPFDPLIQFVILIHPEEVRRRIATGRLSHFCLSGSLFLEGEHFSNHAEVDQLISNSDHACFVLYPGKESLNLSTMSELDKIQAFSPTLHENPNHKLTVFVMDGTWRTAKKMLRLSPNLAALPTVSFNTPRPSGFQIRKQPAPECFSTIEAIHHMIELLGESRGFQVSSRKHDHLLQMFDKMVQRQIDYQRRFTAARESLRQ